MSECLRRRYLPALVPGRARECRASQIRAKPWKQRRAWKSSHEELPGVWGAERIDGGGGNWGGPPRPGSLRIVLPERGVL